MSGRVFRQRTRTSLSAPTPPVVKTLFYPAPVGGVNALSGLFQMPATDCLWAFNLMPSEFGMEIRKGYREWAKDIGGVGTHEQIRTVVPYGGVQADNSDNRLFAMTSTGIYDVTLFNTIDPTPVFTWAVTGGNKAGYGVFTNFANDADAQFIYYADTENGAHIYTASTDSWAAVIDLTVDDGLGAQVPWGLEADVTAVTSHKLRLWFTIDDSGDAFYLPVDSISGEVFKFIFGSKFKHGGYLMGLWSWSYESTAGVQDYLVAISRAGDVLVYRGSDPTQPDWSLVGSYFIGEVTNSRNIAVNYGSEMYVLSTFGITAMSDLIKGHEAYVPGGTSPSTKITRVLRRAVQAGKASKDWQLRIDPAQGILQVTSPYTLGRERDAIQYTQNILTNAWGYWRGVPIQSATPLEGEYFFGSQDGQVFLMSGQLDNTLLTGSLGEPIEFEVMTSFQVGDNPSTFKRAGYARTIGILEGEASLSVRVVYDLRLQNRAPPPGALGAGTSTLWDIGEWDNDVWDASLVGSDTTIGVQGMGRAMAINIKGLANSDIVVSGWDVTYTEGAFL